MRNSNASIIRIEPDIFFLNYLHNPHLGTLVDFDNKWTVEEKIEDSDSFPLYVKKDNRNNFSGKKARTLPV
ncbi:MAG: hypothetical protein ACYS1A_12155 [Planctomycetota bacterium]|jgi:hypothetical protein